MTNRALIVVLSDLHDETALPALKLLAQRHDCVTLRFRDPAERGLPKAGILFAREAETGATFVVRGSRARLTDGNFEQALKRAHIDTMTIDTDQPFAHRLRHFFRSRDVFGRGAR
jgi:hypothetical protein